MAVHDAERVTEVGFLALPDLASERLGGRALLANDEFFAPKENLLHPGRGIHDPDRFTDVGKWYDGWETRRRRTEGHDWCIIKLGLAGRVHGVEIDTNHFLGNHPETASVDACAVDGDPAGNELAESSTHWTELLPKSALSGGSRNIFELSDERRWTHVRLNIHPDGGVARFRVHGVAVPDWSRIDTGTPIDVASVVNGGLAIARSDDFFGLPHNMLFPDRPPHMGDGWETRRRRGPGHDWCVVRLGATSTILRIVVDTTHFKGNFPDSCSIEGTLSTTDPDDSGAWEEVLPSTKLKADTEHEFDRALLERGPFSHLRINIFPDGGVARLRAFGFPVPGAGA